MITENRAAASRFNGAQSRGPKTEGGKAAAVRNAMKHGLRSSAIVTQSESRQEWEDHQRATQVAIRPTDYIEQILADRVAVHSGRLSRAVKAETLAIAAQGESMIAVVTRKMSGEVTGSPSIEDADQAALLQRYETSAEPALWRTLAALRDHRGATIFVHPRESPD